MIDTLTQILEDLGKHKNTDRDSLLLYYIESRLNKSFQTYYDELSKNVIYLGTKNELRMARHINRDD